MLSTQSLDFRAEFLSKWADIKLSDSIDQAITAILSKNTKIIGAALTRVQMQAIEFYKSQNNSTDTEAFNKGKELYSQFLQNLIYFMYHNIRHSNDHKFQKTLLEDIVNYLIYRDDFFYKNNSNAMTHWADPKTHWTALHVLCFEGDYANAEELLAMLAVKCDVKSDKYKTYFSHQDKCKYSAFTSACSNGHSNIVTLLLNQAEKIFQDDQEGFIEYFFQSTKEEHYAWDLAVLGGHYNIVELLLNKMKEICKDDKELYLSYLLRGNFLLLHEACRLNHIEIAQLLLNELKQVIFHGIDEGDTNAWAKAYERYLECLSLNSIKMPEFSLLHSACKEGHIEMVRLLLQEIFTASENDEQFQTFLENENKFTKDTPLYTTTLEMSKIYKKSVKETEDVDLMQRYDHIQQILINDGANIKSKNRSRRRPIDIMVPGSSLEYYYKQQKTKAYAKQKLFKCDSFTSDVVTPKEKHDLSFSVQGMSKGNK